MDTIDWKKQWELFCPYFKNGICKVPLKDFCTGSSEEILLSPGGGFGDLSHPTTHLMMELIGKFCKDKDVIDLGCGSGILSLAALKLGAKKAYSLDIEDDALFHTRENATLNRLQKKIITGKTLKKGPSPDVLFLNMTFYEQKEALSSLPVYPGLWITSGILKEQEEIYLKYIDSLGLELLSSHEKNGWLAFVFQRLNT
jgi:ribosomal protein L11 methyltransferase